MDRLEFYHMLHKFKSFGIGATAAGAWRTRHDLDLRIGVFSMTNYLSSFALLTELYKHHLSRRGG